jgi:CRISPR/Cas system CSM-associated protein Csm3 (group 7 of RAMP superfamily)
MSIGWRESREIVERIIVEGNLVLLTPTSLGNGDNDGLTDMSLLLDEAEGKALLTGTSIAGALRNYLRECLLNYGESEESHYKDSEGDRLKVKDASGNIVKDANGKTINISLPIVTQLFGSLKDDGAQSCLMVDDSIGGIPQTELRDGVRIDGATRTAKDKAKFDLELLEAGTTFKLRFELLIGEGQNRTELVPAFATALHGFERGEIFIGARKRRGYGECKVSKWRVKMFDLIAGDKTGLIDWLRNGAKPLADLSTAEQDSITSALGASSIPDQREYFEMTACFALDGSMLIRSGSRLSNVSEKGQPDTVHLRSKHKDKGSVPVVSGTSLAGVLRHRAVKICNTIADGRGKSFVEKIFGVDMEELKKRNKNKRTKEQPHASRLEVKETFIENTNDLVQTRVKIDRFTGGAFEGALFDAAPIFAKSDEKATEISLKLRKPNEAEIGLLLLLLKDLWTSDLAIGGESSIGRGRLKGISASLHKRKSATDYWKISLKETDKIEVQLVEGSLPNNEAETKFLNGLAGALRVELEKDNASN